MSTTSVIDDTLELLREANRVIRTGGEVDREAFRARKDALLSRIDDDGDRFLVNAAAAEVDNTPAYERGPQCPSWCAEHDWNTSPTTRPSQFAGHAGPLGAGDDVVELYLAADGSSHAADDCGVERTPERLRAFALTLLEAADVLEGRPGSSRVLTSPTRDEAAAILGRLGIDASDDTLGKLGYTA